MTTVADMDNRVGKIYPDGTYASHSGIATRTGATSARGFEPMPEPFAWAKQRSSDTLNFENRSITANEPHEFDLVLCFDVFEHIEDFYSFLRDLRSMADHFLFHIPLDMNAQMVARGEPMRRVRDEVGHIHYFSKDSALAVLEEAGFVVKNHEYTAGNDGCYASRAFRLMAFPRRIVRQFSPDLAARVLGGFSLMVYATPAVD